MVGNNAHGHIGILTLTIGNACLGCNLLNEGLEDVGVVVRLLALHHHAEAFETHTGVYMFGLEGFESAVSQTVELHEHEVPYLDNQGIVLINQLGAGNEFFVGFIADVDMYLTAGTAGALVAHLPEIVLLRAFKNAAFVHVLLPEVVGFGVHG